MIYPCCWLVGKPRSETVDPLSDLLRRIVALPLDWHGAGTVSPIVLEALRRHATAGGEIRNSVETGTGRTTLLLSHLSRNHLVFTQDDSGEYDSLSRVRASELLNLATVTFVVGPTQRTLVGHEFTAPIDLAFIDGPHAYPFPELEYWAIYPHLVSGALLVIDDVQIPTIANLVDVLSADAMYDLIEVVHTAAFFRRTSAPAVDPYGEGWWLQGINARPTHRHLPARERIMAAAKLNAPSGVRGVLGPLLRMAGSRPWSRPR